MEGVVLWLPFLRNVTGIDTIILSDAMASWNSLSIGSGNGLVPDGTKPSPEPVMTWNPRQPSRWNLTENENDIDNENQENIKVPHYWTLAGTATSDR